MRRARVWSGVNRTRCVVGVMSELSKPPNAEVPPDVAWDSSITLLGYQRAVRETDHLPDDGLRTAALGLFGEVGSLLSIVKKRNRDAAAFTGYEDAILEELGDILWYFTCLINRASMDLSIVAQRAVATASVSDAAADELGTWGNIQSLCLQASDEGLFQAMSRLAELSGSLVGGLCGDVVQANRDDTCAGLVQVLQAV